MFFAQDKQKTGLHHALVQPIANKKCTLFKGVTMPQCKICHETAKNYAKVQK